MNRNQWFMLSIIFWILMISFVKIDTSFNCDMFSDKSEALDKYDIWCIVNSEIYDPFIWMFAILGITFFIGAWLEPKNIEEDIPIKHKEVMKLAKLEHEVKELKNRLKEERKIKS